MRSPEPPDSVVDPSLRRRIEARLRAFEVRPHDAGAQPRADLSAACVTRFDTSIPCLTNPLGAKGVGELGTIGATPAAVNAVIDALAHAGLGRRAERIRMPVTAQRVWHALAGES